MTKRHIVIATRESPLALCQAEEVKTLLQKKHPHLSVDILGMTTAGDQWLSAPLAKVGGKGLFVKELEEALLDGRADLAVHSMKDVPMDLPPGLCIPIVLAREDVRDVFVSPDYASYNVLPAGAVVGTASVRRETQLRAIRSDVIIQPLRGNVNTRLKRLMQGDFAGIVLAAAGLKRLGLASHIRAYFSVEALLPAAGQGALGIECREDDSHLQALLAPLNDSVTFNCVAAERALSRTLGGNCQVPVGAYAHIERGQLVLRGLVADKSGIKILRAHHEGSAAEAEHIGITVAKELLQQGADKILRDYWQKE